MDDYPHLRALLRELLQLEAGDEALPVRVLVNMYRPHFRTPLEGLAALADGTYIDDYYIDDGLDTLADYLSKHWPTLKSDLFRASGRLDELTRVSEGPWMLGKRNDMIQSAAPTTPVVAEMISRAYADWQAYEPLYSLHSLTWSQQQAFDAICEMLDIELQLAPAVRELILAFSR